MITKTPVFQTQLAILFLYSRVEFSFASKCCLFNNSRIVKVQVILIVW